MTESKISTPWLTSWLYIWLTLWSTPWLTPWLTFCQSPWLTKFAMSGQFRTLAMFVQEPKTCISGELWTPNGGMVRSKQSRTGSQGAAPSLPAAPDCQTWTQKANAHCRATFWGVWDGEVHDKWDQCNYGASYVNHLKRHTKPCHGYHDAFW